MHKLYLLRHAKSDWKNVLINDFERPLSKRGFEDAPKMASWLKRRKVMPDYIVSSPALRAYQTILLITQGLEINPAEVHFDKLVYAADRETLLEVIKRFPESQFSALLVGHNPGLDDVLLALCPNATPQSNGKLMTTCAVAEVQVNSHWSEISQDKCVLQGLFRIKDIVEM